MNFNWCGQPQVFDRAHFIKESRTEIVLGHLTKQIQLIQ